MIYNVPKKKRFLKVQKWMPSKEKKYKDTKDCPRLQKRKDCKDTKEKAAVR